MILARWPRWKGLLLVFVAQLAFGVLVAPVVVAPVFIEESVVAPDEALREYGEYLWSVVTFEWIGRGDSDWILAAVCLAWTLLAVAFISPIVGPARREPAGRALWPSVIAAATLGAFIVAMLFAAIVEGAVALVSADQSTFSDAYDSIGPWIWLAALVVWCVSGAGWAFLLRRIGRSRDPGEVDRLLRLVFAGTAVELVLGLPIYLMVRKKYSCYCGMATFLNLVMGMAALCWLCGPWMVLLWTKDARRNWSRGSCRSCGYPQRSGSAVCSECGAALG